MLCKEKKRYRIDSNLKSAMAESKLAMFIHNNVFESLPQVIFYYVYVNAVRVENQTPLKLNIKQISVGQMLNIIN